jgi:hypothetical protein
MGFKILKPNRVRKLKKVICCLGFIEFRDKRNQLCLTGTITRAVEKLPVRTTIFCCPKKDTDIRTFQLPAVENDVSICHLHILHSLSMIFR